MSIMDERDKLYGDAWALSGQFIALAVNWRGPADRTPFEVLSRSGYVYNWIQMLGKICRALFSPEHIDNWKDIEGYAALIVRDMEGENASDNKDIPF